MLRFSKNNNKIRKDNGFINGLIGNMNEMHCYIVCNANYVNVVTMHYRKK